MVAEPCGQAVSQVSQETIDSILRTYNKKKRSIAGPTRTNLSRWKGVGVSYDFTDL